MVTATGSGAVTDRSADDAAGAAAAAQTARRTAYDEGDSYTAESQLRVNLENSMRTTLAAGGALVWALLGSVQNPLNFLTPVRKSVLLRQTQCVTPCTGLCP